MTDLSTTEQELLELAELSANGLINPEQSEQSKDYYKGFHIISKIKQSFNQANNANHNYKIKQGDQWGHLQLLEEIGRGGMGQVFAAKDQILERDVAVKFLNSNATSYINNQTFIDEARRLAKIRHPHVLAIFGANTFKHLPGFWSERLKGQTLEQFPVNQLNWKKVCQLALELTSALQEIHKNQLIHGDIKPQNVIVEPVRGAVLMDFGSAIDATKKNNLITSSTPLIMAPELFSGNKKTEKSDVYALGVLFYYLSNNKQYPYQANSLTELAEIVCNKAQKFSQIAIGPKSWHKLIQSMMSSNPNNRPDSKSVYKQLTEIQQRPQKHLKRMVIATVFTLLLGITSTVIYSNFKLKQANQTTQTALKETTQVNDLLHNLLSSASPTAQGKDVLMVDVIDEFVVDILKSNNIGNSVKAKALSTLTHTLNSLGHKDKSMRLIEETLELDDLPPVITSQLLNSKARFMVSKYDQNIKLDEAIELITQAQLLLPQTGKYEDYIKAKIDITKAFIARRQNNFETAKINIKSAIDYWQNSDESKEKHLNLGTSIDFLGHVNSDLGLINDAISNYQTAIKHFKQSSNKFNSNMMMSMNNLAGLYGSIGRNEEARDQFKILVKESETLLGKHHINRLGLIANYAFSLSSVQQGQQAIDTLEPYMEAIIEQAGIDSLLYLHAMGVLADSHKVIGDYQTGEQYYQAIIKQAKSNFGSSHYMVYLNSANLAELYTDNGQFNQAHDLLKPLVAPVTTDLGPKNMITLEVLEFYAWAAFKSGDKETAQNIFPDVIEAKKEVYGPDNDSTLRAIARFAEINQ